MVFFVCDLYFGVASSRGPLNYIHNTHMQALRVLGPFTAEEVKPKIPSSSDVHETKTEQNAPKGSKGEQTGQTKGGSKTKAKGLLIVVCMWCGPVALVCQSPICSLQTACPTCPIFFPFFP